MTIIKLDDVTKTYGDKTILDKIHLDINEGDKIGLIGLNGSGKSTLFKIIMNEISPDQGKVEIKKGITTGYLKQATDYTKDDFINISEDKESISNFLKTNNELNINKNITVDTLSGGEKTKLALSKILITNPDLLLLDEPTNHMDIDGVNWLIDKINSYQGTVIIISHDRFLLNNTVNKIIELKNGKLKEYYGTYDDYEEEKERELELLKEKYFIQEKQDKKIKKEIQKLNQWSNKGEREANKQGGSPSDAKIKGAKTMAQRKAAKLSRMAKNKKMRLEQSRNSYIEKPREEKEIKYKFNGFQSNSKTLIKITNLAKSYNRLLFKDVNLIVESNDKIGLIGPNGIGKSTFIKILMNKEEKDEGEIEKSSTLKPYYMTQDVFDLDEDKTIFKLAEKYDNETKQLFFSNLVNMGFDRDEFNNKIKSLSLGQRMRIKISQIILNDYNLLILDEPTNHLDLPNKKELERSLVNFKGAVILASHDQYLLSKVTNKLFIFKNSKIIEYNYGYKEFIER